MIKIKNRQLCFVTNAITTDNFVKMRNPQLYLLINIFRVHYSPRHLGIHEILISGKGIQINTEYAKAKVTLRHGNSK